MSTVIGGMRFKNWNWWGLILKGSWVRMIKYKDLTLVNPEDLERFTCEQFAECGYSSEVSNNALASHLRKVHGMSSRGFTLDEFVAEGFIIGLDENIYHATDFLLERVYGI